MRLAAAIGASGLIAMAMAGAAPGAPQKIPLAGASEAQLKAMEREFERLTGFVGRARALSARVERVEAPAAARRLAGLPRGPQAWANGPGLEAGRAALVSVSAGSGPQSQCAVIQAPENLPGSPEQRLRERLSSAAGQDAWIWLLAHEMGHCAHGFLRAQGEAPERRGEDAASEAFADIFALEWARRAGGAPPAWGPELIKARESAGAEHANARALWGYWQEASKGAPLGSLCQIALRHAEPKWRPARLPC